MFLSTKLRGLIRDFEISRLFWNRLKCQRGRALIVDIQRVRRGSVKIDKIIAGKIIGNHEEGQTRGSEHVNIGSKSERLKFHRSTRKGEVLLTSKNMSCKMAELQEKCQLCSRE